MKKNNLILLLFAVCLAFASCDDSGQKENEKKEVTIGMVTFPGYAPLYLAKEKNLFKGVDVKLVRIESIGDLRAAMNSGQIDIYAATYDIFQNIENVQPPGIGFIAIDESHGADGIVVKEGINNIADLKGKVVGAEPGFPPFFILQYLLNQENMSLADVNFKDLSSQDAGNAFAAGKLDAAGTYEPYLSKSSEIRPGSKILISSANTNHLIVDFLFASEDLVNNDQELLVNVARGWFDALDYYSNNEEESLKIMGDAFGVSPEEMKDFKTGVTWLGIGDNNDIFDKTKTDNAYQVFDLVHNILSRNQDNIYKVNADDKLTGKVISELTDAKAE